MWVSLLEDEFSFGDNRIYSHCARNVNGMTGPPLSTSSLKRQPRAAGFDFSGDLPIIDFRFKIALKR